jgi:toluene monooxygenase system protein B
MTEMPQIPLCTSFEGDFLVRLVLVEDGDTMDQVAAKAAAQALGRTVRGLPGSVLRVRLQGVDWALDRQATVKTVGLGPMECIEVYQDHADKPGGAGHV